MSVIIRLQNLPWSANALDIRQFFHGLSIPEGGVHIVGGELGDAFIAFSTDEDARQAFERNNGKIKEVQIKLMLSSRAEMQKVIEAARSLTMAPYLPTPTPAAIPQTTTTSIKSQKSSSEKDKDEDNNEKHRESNSRRRGRSRSHSRSRDRDRRDRRRKDRSRSRSRDRRERRRRDRSYSRERHRSRDRKTSKERRYSDQEKKENNALSTTTTTKPMNPWKTPINNQNPSLIENTTLGMNLGTFLPNLFPQLNPASRVGGLLNSNDTNLALNNFKTSNSTFIPPSLNLNPNMRFNNSNMPSSYNSASANLNQNSINNNRFASSSSSSSCSAAASAATSSFNQRSSSTGFNFNQFGQSQSQSHQQNEQPDNCCIKLHPFYGGFGEIRRFFSGLYIHNSGIKLLNDKFGKRTGWVYVRFVYPDAKEEALRRNGGFIRKQQVEVKHLSDEEFDKEVDRYQPDLNQQQHYSNQTNKLKSSTSMSHDRERDGDEDRGEQDDDCILLNNDKEIKNYTCLVLEDLPSYVKEQDVLKIFSDFSLMSIIITENKKQKKTLLAYVKFANAEHAKNACLGTATHTLEGKLLKVRPCRDEEFNEVNKLYTTAVDEKLSSSSQQQQQQQKVLSECVLLTGLLPQTKISERDIADFFCDVGIVPEKINLLHLNEEEGTTAYCLFNTLEEAQAACSKNGMYLGTNVISVKSLSKIDYEKALGLNVVSPNNHLLTHTQSQQLQQVQQQNSNFLSNNHGNGNGNSTTTTRPFPHSHSHSHSHSHHSSSSFNNNNMRPLLNNNFNNMRFNQRIPPYNMNMNMNMNMPSSYGGNNNNRNFNFGCGGNGMNSGCTVLMENVPYKAELEEILEFFSDFNILPDNVLRRYNMHGQPSGETKVIFPNPDEAHRAVQTMNREKIRDRVVYLSLC